MKLVRVEVAQPAVGAGMVVVLAPRGSAAPGIGKRLEPVQVEALVAETAVEALGKRVLHRLAGVDELEFDTESSRPLLEVRARELGAVVADEPFGPTSLLDGLEQLDGHVRGAQRGADFHSDALAREVVDDREHADGATVRELVVNEVHAPTLRRSGWQNHWAPNDWLESSATSPADSQALLRVDASDSALPDLEALSDHSEVHSPIPVMT